MIRVLLLALLVVAGCSSGTPTAPADRLVLRLSAEEESRQPVEAVRGQVIELTVTSGKPVEVHVHGFDVRGDADAGKPAVLEFTADRTGTFDVEAHPDTLLARLIVR
ncbi:hypothetical protein [Saccharothrix sp. NRRL B-16314]|uniref:hypothetical protein n=1 Tax=Saccharothrix sp. NRRL B-16314 TaxID=1463825 RepID=UPI000689BFD7|nr:hypothetical protein [Saccharothrix sp. NRRL B-16314]